VPREYHLVRSFSRALPVVYSTLVRDLSRGAARRDRLCSLSSPLLPPLPLLPLSLSLSLSLSLPPKHRDRRGIRNFRLLLIRIWLAAGLDDEIGGSMADPAPVDIPHIRRF